MQLLWTDPQELPGWGPSKRVGCPSNEGRDPYEICRDQGVGIAFGPDVTRRWCDLNKITGILRSHEVRQGRKMNGLFHGSH